MFTSNGQKEQRTAGATGCHEEPRGLRKALLSDLRDSSTE